jgi:hypothetical protein
LWHVIVRSGPAVPFSLGTVMSYCTGREVKARSHVQQALFSTIQKHFLVWSAQSFYMSSS